MSDQSDSQNKSEEQVNMSEGTSPSSSYADGSRSTPINLPKAATRARKKRTSDSKDLLLLALVAAFGKLLGVLLLPSSKLLEGLVPSLK